MKMVKYIGENISKLLDTKPFANWKFERFVEDDDMLEPGVDYIFYGHGLEVNCNDNDYIRTIFLHSDSYGGTDKSLVDIPFSFTREKVLKYFNMPPERSKEGFVDPILGEIGGHDRFRLSDALVHIQYKPKIDEIKTITFMKEDAFPVE